MVKGGDGKVIRTRRGEGDGENVGEERDREVREDRQGEEARDEGGDRHKGRIVLGSEVDAAGVADVVPEGSGVRSAKGEARKSGARFEDRLHVQGELAF